MCIKKVCTTNQNNSWAIRFVPLRIGSLWDLMLIPTLSSMPEAISDNMVYSHTHIIKAKYTSMTLLAFQYETEKSMKEKE